MKASGVRLETATRMRTDQARRIATKVAGRDDFHVVRFFGRRGSRPYRRAVRTGFAASSPPTSNATHVPELNGSGLAKIARIGIFPGVKITATKLANDSKAVIDRVIQRGETAEVQRHGKTVAKIQRKVGASREEMAELLKSIKFSKSETKELKKAMDAASDVFGYAGRD